MAFRLSVHILGQCVMFWTDNSNEMEHTSMLFVTKILFFQKYIHNVSSQNSSLFLSVEPPRPSLNVSLMCSVGSVRADLQWQVSSLVFICWCVQY